ncbi:MAG: hypothetical protein L0177_13645 [Chloroflexi bacterium]|nr:hypothetical protein [Chloroflexota bacterium]
MVETRKNVLVQVELFGVARMVCGARVVEIAVPEIASVDDVAAALAQACPSLVGKAILGDRSGLMASYTLNLNGTAFLDAEDELRLKAGDTLLLFSSQAGG